MKVLLVKPNYNIHVNTPPLGLAYIASSLELDGHKVEFLDCMIEKLTVEDSVERIIGFSPEAVGFTVMSPSHNQVKEMVTGIKQRQSDLPVFLGGPHVSALPQFVLKDLPADVAVVGEGEITCRELINAWQKKSGLSEIKGIVYRKKNGAIVTNPKRELIKNLDDLPFPAWHLMPPEKYKTTPLLSSVENQPIAPISTSRGCPYDCTYCASHVTWEKKWRKRSPKNVVDEIEFLMDRFGVREVHLNDDNFTLSYKFATAVCEEIISRNLKISWQCPNGVRVDRLDEKLLGLMKKAGCHTLGFGIESGNQRILDNVKKSLDLELTNRVVATASKLGMTTFGFFVLGLPGESKQTIRETIKFAKSLALDRAWFFIHAPMPGAELFQEYLKVKKLVEINWDDLNTYMGLMELDDITPAELEKARTRAAYEFYARPKLIWDLAKRIRLSNLKTLFKWWQNRLQENCKHKEASL